MQHFCAAQQSFTAQALGVPEVQVHEPVLTLSDAAGLETDFTSVYGAFAEVRWVLCPDLSSRRETCFRLDSDSY